MKKTIITLTLICLSLFINAQSDANVSYISKDKDTLMLPNNQLGKLIASTWKDTPSKEKKPIIVFADEKTIRQRKQQAIASRDKWHTDAK
jgi:hypothetical protein